MPWTYDDPPAVAQNWTEEERRRCVDAANAVMEESEDEEQAIFACIRAAGKQKMKHEKKTFRGPVTLKQDGDGQAGEFSAVFATLNVIDADGDVTLPGAFEDGQKVKIAYWGHRWEELPVGKGVIHADEQQAWVEGRFFLDTEAGRETYQTVKSLEDLQEWSYGFDILESGPGKVEEKDVRILKRLTVHEVSPVMLGSGVATHTVDIKSGEIGTHTHTIMGMESHRLPKLGEWKAGRILAQRNADRLIAALNELTAVLQDAGLIERDDSASEEEDADEDEAARQEARGKSSDPAPRLARERRRWGLVAFYEH